MISKIFSIRDNKAGAFMQPFYMPNQAMAIRAISDCVSDQNHMFNKHAMDYDLYYLGEFDDASGKTTALETPEHVVSCVQLKSEGDE